MEGTGAPPGRRRFQHLPLEGAIVRVIGRCCVVLWHALSEGGILLYATCSVLPDENDQVIGQFLATNANASVLNIDADWGIKTDYGRQLFPKINGNDGFYYSRLQKAADNNSE